VFQRAFFVGCEAASGRKKCGLLLGLGRSEGGLGLGKRDADHGVAVLALDELAADVVGDGKDLTALEIGAEQLNGHGVFHPPLVRVSIDIIDHWQWRLEEA
jgi:hypothetical protein